MTQEQFTRNLPPLAYNPLPVKPPIMFNNLSARFFPLRASLDVLQQLCDGYLNMVPPEAGRFRVAMPYVFLSVLDYGQMSLSIKESGWFAQVEVYFGVPLEWYKLVNGQWVFFDWGVFTPYIFVDDSFSAPLGRTVYGFPKILSRVAATDSQWIKDPLAPVNLVRVETMVFPEAYAGLKLDREPFLEVERAAPMMNLKLPWSSDSPLAPWNIASNLASAIGGLGRDLGWMVQGMRVAPLNHPTAYPGAFIPQMLARMMPALGPAGPGFVLNSLNIKQFRRSDNPAQICYQGLTNGQMITTAFNGGGMLGEERILLGDLSGGHTVRLYQHSSLPITRTLGLEIDRTVNYNGVEVFELKPVMPLWIDVDVKYDNGTNVAWRTRNGVWKDAGGEHYPNQTPIAGEQDGPLFNATVTTAIEAIAGPFQFTDSTIRVLPLLAKRKKLQTFLDEYLNKALDADIYREGDLNKKERLRFSVWARPPVPVSDQGYAIGGDHAYVYLTASSFGGVTSQTNNVGDWANYETSFLVPVKWERCKTDKPGPCHENDWETVGVGVVPFLTLVDQAVAAISRSEVQGINALTANFVRPESVWLGEGEDEAGIGPSQGLLRVDAEVVIGAGQKARYQPLIQISQRVNNAGLGSSQAAPWAWSELQRLELGTKRGVKAFYTKALQIGRALSLELLGNKTPFCIYTLKQFRDVRDPDKACYQSLVRVPRIFDNENLDVREIQETLVVHIHDYPKIEIVETLGIIAERLPESATGIVYSAQAVRPFFIRTNIDEPLAQRLLSRTGESWTVHACAFNTLLSSEEKADTAENRQKIEKLTAAQEGQHTPAVSNPTEATEDQILGEEAEALKVARLAAATSYYQEAPPYIAANLLAERLQDQIDPCCMANNMYNAREHLHWIQEGKNALYLTDEIGPNEKTDRPQVDISKFQARDALKHIDAQGVIEAVLSREWGNNDDNALWRQGRRDLLELVEALPEGGGQKGATENALFEQLNNVMASRPGAVAFALGEQDDDRNQHSQPEPSAVARMLTPLSASRDPGATWRATMNLILRRQKEFIEAQGKMEHSLNEISSFAILGMSQYHPSDVTEAVDIKTKTDELVKAGTIFFQQLEVIAGLHVEGEPSDVTDIEVKANVNRLKALLAILVPKVKGAGSNEWKLEAARQHLEEFRQVVALARKHCDAQRNALVNKLSRAYQRPDYCIRRDSVGDQRDHLLPLSLSWDKDWYFG